MKLVLEGTDRFARVVKYPDGQQNIVLTDKVLSRLYLSFPVEILTRLRNWSDLELLVCMVKCLNNAGMHNIHLSVTYFCGARSDRKFEVGGNAYLKDVICPIINSLNLTSVIVLEPHSDVLGSLLNKYIDNSNNDFGYNIAEIKSLVCKYLGDDSKLALISPDAGAFKRVSNIRDKFFPHSPIAIGAKIRDVQSGKIVGTDIYNLPNDHNSIIFDDLCDGGRTFIELAKKIRETNNKKLYLSVVHGIFSAGLDTLTSTFDNIFVTNSFSDLPKHDKVDIQTVI